MAALRRIRLARGIPASHGRLLPPHPSPDSAAARCLSVEKPSGEDHLSTLKESSPPCATQRPATQVLETDSHMDHFLHPRTDDRGSPVGDGGTTLPRAPASAAP